MLAFFYQKPLAAILAYFVAFLVAQSRVEARIHRPFEVLWGPFSARWSPCDLPAGAAPRCAIMAPT